MAENPRTNTCWNRVRAFCEHQRKNDDAFDDDQAHGGRPGHLCGETVCDETRLTNVSNSPQQSIAGAFSLLRLAHVRSAVVDRRSGESRDLGMRFTVPLCQSFEHNGFGRHVDSKCKRFGSEDRLEIALLEKILDDLLESWDQPGMMRCNAAL